MDFKKDPKCAPIEMRRDVEHLVEMIYTNLKQPYASIWISQVTLLAPRCNTTKLCKAMTFWILNELTGMVDSIRARRLKRTIAFYYKIHTSEAAHCKALVHRKTKKAALRSRGYAQKFAVQAMAFAIKNGYRSSAQALRACMLSRIAVRSGSKKHYQLRPHLAPHTDPFGCYTHAAVTLLVMLNRFVVKQ